FLNIVFFEFADALRSRWMIFYALVVFSFSLLLLSMASGSADVAASLLNFILLIVPLFILIYGVVAFHNSLPFQRVIIALGVKRTTIYTGQFLGRLAGLLPGFIGGLLLAFIFGGAIEGFTSLMLILVYGVLLNAVFLALAFFLSQLSERIELLVAFAIGIWFILYILYDSIILVLVIFMGDFPLEGALLTLTFLNPIDTARAVVLMQSNLQSLMTHSSAVYAKVLSGYIGVSIGTLVLCIQACVVTLWGLCLYKHRNL
ncbi:MAG TPA: hypothetical protein PLY93_06480, partial [Turneriella sp.]|nr:hypothetical protein [Turneriella sp.]